MSTLSKTISHGGIYALSNILRWMTSIVMLPIYTRYLTPADYGVLELLTTTIDLAAIIFGLRIGEAIFRSYEQETGVAAKNAVVTTAMAVHGTTFGIGALGIILIAAPLSSIVFGSSDYAHFVRMFAVLMVLQALSEVPMVLVRAQQRPWLFFAFSVTKLCLQVSLNVYFIVIQGLHVEGVVYGSLISSLLYSTILIAFTLQSTRVARPDSGMAQKLVAFSFPLMVADIGTFYLNFGDRYFLRVFSDLHELGVYALAYKFGFILGGLVWSPFCNVWDVQKYQIHGRPDGKKVFQGTFLMLNFILIYLGFGMSLFASEFLKLMSAKDFWPAAQIIPIVVLAYLVQVWGGFCSFGVLLAGRTIQLTYGAFVAAAVITIGYMLLIPEFGGIGAATATVIAFLVRFVWVDVASRKHFDMELQWGRVVTLLGLAVVLYFVGTWLSPADLVWAIAWKCLVSAVFLGVFMLLPILTNDQKALVFQLLKNPRSGWRLTG